MCCVCVPDCSEIYLCYWKEFFVWQINSFWRRELRNRTRTTHWQCNNGNVIASSGLKFYIIVFLAILYHLLYCNFIPMSVLVYYTYVWMGTLYHCLDSNIIPLSALHFYTYFCYTILYLGLLWLLLLLPNWIYSLLCLLLVCNIISTSVISNSVFPNLFQTGYTYVWFAKLYLHLLYLLLLWSNWIIPMSGIGKMMIIP